MDILYPPCLDEMERPDKFLIVLEFFELAPELEVVFSPRLEEELL